MICHYHLIHTQHSNNSVPEEHLLRQIGARNRICHSGWRPYQTPSLQHINNNANVYEVCVRIRPPLVDNGQSGANHRGKDREETDQQGKYLHWSNRHPKRISIENSMHCTSSFEFDQVRAHYFRWFSDAKISEPW